MARVQNCNSCGKESLNELIDLGPQVVCHHFLRNSTEQEYFHDLALGQCDACGTVQLTDRIPVNEMIPRYDWLTCTEPEAHLDRLVKFISQLPGVTKESKICGISFKDDSTLDRFNKLGFKNTWRADPFGELGITNANAGIESLQGCFTSRNVDRLIKNHGRSDVLIARQLIEHTYDLRGFMEVCQRLISPDGYIVFEIPDCQRAFEKFDYTTIWEQHMVYFTGRTFRNCFKLNGLSLVHFERIPYSIEDSYIGIAQIDKKHNVAVLTEDVLREEMRLGRRFADEYPKTKNKFKKFFADYQNDQGKVALFGGGHMGCAFLNLFELKDFFEFVVDDNPHMQGLFMPGSRLPILGSKTVYDKDIKLCILTLSAATEEEVIRNNQKFLEKGGRFLSIFPGSKWAMEV